MKQNRRYRLLALVMAMVMFVPALSSHISALPEQNEFSAGNIKTFQAEEVRAALLAKKPSAAEKDVLKSVLLPASFDIKIPRIDSARVQAVYSPLLSEMAEYKTFWEELAEHGYSEEQAAQLTFAEYREIEAAWEMDEKHTDIFKKLYPELADTDLTGWTIGDSQAYGRKRDAESFRERFSAAQIAEMKRRNIQIEDMHALLKEFHQIEAVLAQPDSVLKNTLEDYYRLYLGMQLGGEAESEIVAKAAQS